MRKSSDDARLDRSNSSRQPTPPHARHVPLPAAGRRTWPREPVRPMTFITIASFTGVSCSPGAAQQHAQRTGAQRTAAQQRGGAHKGRRRQRPAGGSGAPARRAAAPRCRQFPELCCAVCTPRLAPRSLAACIAGGIGWPPPAQPPRGASSVPGTACTGCSSCGRPPGAPGSTRCAPLTMMPLPAHR